MTLYVLATGLLALLGAAGWLWWRSYRSGKRDERLDSAERSLDLTKEANDVEDDVAALSDADIRERLSEWNRD